MPQNKGRALAPGEAPLNPAVQGASSAAFEVTLFQGAGFFNGFLTPLFSGPSDLKVLKNKELNRRSLSQIAENKELLDLKQGRGIGGGGRGVPANESCKSMPASKAASSMEVQSLRNKPPEIRH